MTVFPRLGSVRTGPWVALVLTALSFAAVGRWVDLTPRVEGEFFFADDDPQLAATRAIRERFSVREQAVLRIRDPGASAEDPAEERDGYREALRRLGEELAGVEGVEAVYSVVTRNADGPLWGRVLLTPDPAATNVVLQVGDVDPGVLVPALEGVVAGFRERAPEFEVVVSGAPVIVEWIRRSLLRDLVVFTAAAAAVFALVVAAVYRDAGILAGTLATGALAVNATLLSLRLLGVSIGLLTANLATIVFVLCLSHAVFITANVRRAAASGRTRLEAVSRGVAETFEGSFWGMATTLLGFLSLLVATARPLRELGVAGALGSVVAMASAYLVYPAFLAGWARLSGSGGGEGPEVPHTGGEEGADGAGRGDGASVPDGLEAPARGGARRRGWRLGAVALASGVLLALGAARLETDPSLLSYFAPGSELRAGLEGIDRDGGSSPLHVAVRHPRGDRLDTPDAMERLGALQASLEADSATGVVLGPSVLVDQARTMPLAGFLPLPVLLDIASSPRLDEVALGFVTPDRSQGLFALRMRESGSGAPDRDAAVDRVRASVTAAGLEPVEVAGLYELQGRLGHLIRESLAVGIGGLLLLFGGVAALVSRHGATTARMWACLAGVPLVVLGVFGWTGVAVDIITSPAANVALAVGVDAMLHLVVRVRRFRRAGDPDPWGSALARVRTPVLAATAILGAGFGLFVLSSFPPTRRFGLAVILGTATAAALALVVLPRWARRAATPS